MDCKAEKLPESPHMKTAVLQGISECMQAAADLEKVMDESLALLGKKLRPTILAFCSHFGLTLVYCVSSDEEKDSQYFFKIKNSHCLMQKVDDFVAHGIFDPEVLLVATLLYRDQERSGDSCLMANIGTISEDDVTRWQKNLL